MNLIEIVAKKMRASISICAPVNLYDTWDIYVSEYGGLDREIEAHGKTYADVEKEITNKLNKLPNRKK